MTRPRAGFWSPTLFRAGGVESWHLTLFKHLDSSRIDNRGLAIIDPGDVDREMAGRLARYAEVTAGHGAMRQLAASVDVLVMWGMACPELFLSGAHCPFTIYVSHGDGTSEWTASSAETADPCIDLFVAVSEPAVESIPAHRRSSAYVLPNGVDADRLIPKVDREAQRAAWGIPQSAKVLGMLARLSAEKDPEALARAINYLPPEWVGVAVGDGEDTLSTVCHAYGTCGTRCWFPGMTDDVGSALNAFDVLLVPSRQEGFGLSAIEAITVGVPVVMTPVGVALKHPYWIHGIPIGDDGREIARVVLRADRERTDPIRLYDRAIASATYSAEMMAKRWADLICEMAAAMEATCSTPN